MTPIDRRRFLGGTLILTGLSATRVGAAELPLLDESSPQAAALGYRHDTSQVDAKKYPSHTASQHCSTCQLYQGAAGSKSGPCPLFAGKSVQSNGWCSSWVKKVG